MILSRQAFDDVVRPGGVSLREPDFLLVGVAVKEYSVEAWLRVPGLRPDELVVDRATATAGDAAGISPVLLVRPAFRAGAGTPGRLHWGWCDSSGRGSGWAGKPDETRRPKVISGRAR